MFIQGNLMFIISPIFGWIRDATQSYAICFNALTLLMCLCIVPWIAEMLWFRFHFQTCEKISLSQNVQNKLYANKLK